MWTMPHFSVRLLFAALRIVRLLFRLVYHRVAVGLSVAASQRQLSQASLGGSDLPMRFLKSKQLLVRLLLELYILELSLVCHQSLRDHE